MPDSSYGAVTILCVTIQPCNLLPTSNPLEYQESTGFKEGDVIAFIAPAGFDVGNRLQGCIVTHRIVTAPYEESGTYYVETKGDAAATKDRVPIPVENIQGLVVGSSKVVSKIMSFVTKWYGFVSLIVVPLIAILIWQIAVLIKAKTAQEKEKIERNQEANLKKINEERNKKIEEIKKKAIEEFKNKEDVDGSY